MSVSIANVQNFTSKVPNHRLHRSQILVARVPPQPQRAVGAQFFLDSIIREIISHLRRELFDNANRLPGLRSNGAQVTIDTDMILKFIQSFYNMISQKAPGEIRVGIFPGYLD